jgi:hypothetical protein
LPNILHGPPWNYLLLVQFFLTVRVRKLHANNIIFGMRVPAIKTLQTFVYPSVKPEEVHYVLKVLLLLFIIAISSVRKSRKFAKFGRQKRFLQDHI